ncbi:MAG: alginate lyase family protein [Prevotella sp.]|jgi:hypothetical protein|nr:alginate lyase family protein [Prevotella sp.]
MKRCYLLALLGVFLSFCSGHKDLAKAARETLHSDILKNAEWAMAQQPQTITDFRCGRSAGGIHDFYSEGDYWWPNPENPDAPYIRRDGMTNPDNFVAHRLVMIRFSKIVGYLASAYILTGKEEYVRQAFLHINAWFTNPLTKMNPNLLYAQAIKGIVTGRGIGIIDTIHLMEVAQGIIRMQGASCADKSNLPEIKAWFDEYIRWLMTHPYGIEEMNAQNNHGTCWVMQVASFARLTGNEEALEFCRLRYKHVLLPRQMAADGSFPRELSRTKPYGYALFNLDAMAAICQILSSSSDNLWKYKTPENLSIRKAIDYMYPYILNKESWNLPPDVMYWDEWPMAQPSLIFAALAYNNSAYFELWRKNKHTSTVDEVERNMPVRNPMIWIN